ncbi:hypothetical protein FQR65_LT02169 [Abscondita terminalis]|nr:hypothetical protein FQR65_LT02169 [Abscondita terminalis]
MLLFVLIVVALSNVADSFTYTNFIVTGFKNCDSNNRSKQYLEFVTENGKQFLTFDINFPRTLDDTVGTSTLIESSINGRTYTPLFQIRDKSACKTANKYLGEFWYDILRAAQIIPGLCPIPKKRYRASMHYLDYSKISLQTFPFGKLKFGIKVMPNDNPDYVILCNEFYIENKIN